MYTTALLLSALATLSVASPLNPDLSARQEAQVTMTFTGGPASYSMSFPADGLPYYTNNQLGISQISAKGITDIAKNCTIKPWEGGVFVTNPDGSLTLGPPGPINWVSCGTAGCVPLYGDCEIQIPNGGGTELLSCCPGSYCAATKCRPMTIS